jgi:hypothetical protein
MVPVVSVDLAVGRGFEVERETEADIRCQREVVMQCLDLVSVKRWELRTKEVAILLLLVFSCYLKL